MIPVAVVFFLGILRVWKLCCTRNFKFNNVAQSLIVLIMYFMHPMVTSLFLSTFQCVWLDQETQLEYDTMRHSLNMKIDCNSEEHSRWMFIAACGIIFWSLGIPLMYWLVLRNLVNSRHRTLQDLDSLRKFGFLYDGFEPEQYYYETIYMIRKSFYLIGATLPWLLEQSRTVILLSMNFGFLAMHLKHQPFDNRAYFGLDRLETLSSITLIWLLLARLLQTGLMSMEFQNLSVEPDIVYLPALISLLWFLFQAMYLLVRSFIWPIDGDCPLLPAKLQYMDQRLVFTTIPTKYDDKDPEFGLLGDNEGKWRPQALPLQKLKQREIELLKTILVEVVELILRRHESCVGSAPKVICLPSFLVQLERVIVMCVSRAIRSRIKSKYKGLDRDTWSKLLKGVGEDTLALAKEMIHHGDEHLVRHINFGSRSCNNLKENQHLIERPVSAEELHVALMGMMPTLLDVRKTTKGNELRRLAFENKGILDMSSHITWVFDPDSHVERLQKYIHSEDSHPLLSEDSSALALENTSTSGQYPDASEGTLTNEEGSSLRQQSLTNASSSSQGHGRTSTPDRITLSL